MNASPTRQLQRPSQPHSFAAIALLLGIGLSACSTPGTYGPGPGVQPESSAVTRGLREARDSWALAHLEASSAASRKERLVRIVGTLEPLLVYGESARVYSKMGDLLLEASRCTQGGEAAQLRRRAETAFVRSMRLVPDWPPAWIGVAETLSDDLRESHARGAPWSEQAAERVDSALRGTSWAVKNIARWGSPRPPGFTAQLLTALTGTRPFPPQPTRKVLPDGSPAMPTARQLIETWLEDDARWSLGNRRDRPSTPWKRQLAIRSALADSRVQLLFAEAREASGEELSEIRLRGTAKAFRIAPDDALAIFHHGAALLMAGEHRDARRMLTTPELLEAPLITDKRTYVELCAAAHAGAAFKDPMQDRPVAQAWFRGATPYGLANDRFWGPIGGRLKAWKAARRVGLLEGDPAWKAELIRLSETRNARAL